jgi:hypothetical protein
MSAWKKQESRLPAAASPCDIKPSTDAGRITFESSLALGQYIAKVHVIGVVVWTTMLAIDYALSQASFVFLLGMLLGNMNLLAQELARTGVTRCLRECLRRCLRECLRECLRGFMAYVR